MLIAGLLSEIAGKANPTRQIRRPPPKSKNRFARIAARYLNRAKVAAAASLSGSARPNVAKVPNVPMPRFPTGMTRQVLAQTLTRTSAKAFQASTGTIPTSASRSKDSSPLHCIGTEAIRSSSGNGIGPTTTTTSSLPSRTLTPSSIG